MQYIDDLEEPVPCQRCNEWFELSDGYSSEKWYPNNVICESCFRIEEKEIQQDDEILDFKNMLSDALHDLKVAENNLIRLKSTDFTSAEKTFSMDFYSWVCNQSTQGRTTEKLWLDYKADQNAKI